MDTWQLYRKHLARCLSLHVTGYHLIMANAWIACYIWCMELDNQLLWLEFLFFSLLPSSLYIRASNPVHISLAFVILIIYLSFCKLQLYSRLELWPTCLSIDQNMFKTCSNLNLYYNCSYVIYKIIIYVWFAFISFHVHAIELRIYIIENVL